MYIYIFFFNSLLYMTNSLFQYEYLNEFNGTPFQFYEKGNIHNNKSNNMTGNLSNTNLSDLNFHQSNIDLLQESIIAAIYKHPETYGTKISKQSEDELLIIMRSIFLQHSKNQPNNIQQQIHELNKLVLDYCIPNIVSAIKQYKGYIKYITKEPEVMEMPQFVNTKGDKTLMPRHFI